MLSFLLCSILSLSLLPSVSAEFVEDRHHVARIIVGAIIGLGCFVIFFICLSYMLRRRRRAGVIPLRRGFYQPEAGSGYQQQPVRPAGSGGFHAGGYQYGHHAHPQSHPNYSNLNLPTYNPPDIPPPAYAKE
ncbi:hypothetical protein AGABI1DRAFT_111760 [Agaricus bisporus var. burnettii JB137-S8]|uniref:Uncharacterized protein n=2 Tax=Agaricus bisporus var. burnettii TaxID=192524 RepID=K5Y0U9_AGABU|nr:hypothetical protein AGABI2DRAFT_192992 [Agaricus bisporus var. bisporus H97]XP_007327339.1 uncharacterized protein AGABI1DRAFT_111760 [Agaricus bisporus var. burnettii JB137-S8]EKM81410.1 hypothetical protein AGABI1DRAFT_111760 [Agaricus bisporus var. burnettii JB137-S8]EKV46194.1 hypothetical protein AGABI2DRAFT_192992 [Agaricus bisporus var. bisporus H97]KAF7770217.1 hypothetical protein Agabi119p4_6191 [Agaricus bisporus var. burnettii]